MMEDSFAETIKAEPQDEDFDDQLMIDDEDLVDEQNIEDPLDALDDENENQVRLEKLPRPVNELNCRQARTFLVKLLRASNGGNNPHYGNPESKPPFWPDYYWPWEALTDVHTKPRGMNEPLQYSEMMKLAIARGYQYFGYDPATYVRSGADAANDIPEPIVNINDEAYVEAPEFDNTKFYLKRPPRLPRPLSKVNCVQSRTALARLLRYQQCGNNPVYGSPDTEPPWWPNDLIRWVDMVDLRGKPPYLPDTKSYTEVLKIAIANAYDYYGYDPELYLDSNQDSKVGLIREKQKMFPVIPASGIAPPPAPRIVNAYQPFGPKPVDKVPMKLQNILPKAPPTNNSVPPSGGFQNGGDDVTEDEQDELPPKLPMPVGKMNCSVTRTCLAKLVRFHCGKGQLPNYGNPSSMPVWWPNHIIDWTKIKNLSHRYEGFLGNTYSNCLRIALIRGYAHYGLDANEYVEASVTSHHTNHYNNHTTANLLESSNNVQEIQLPGVPVTNAVPVKKPMPVLVPLSSLVSEGQYPQSLLDTRDWFPPRLAFSKAIDAPSEAVRSLKACKVSMDRTWGDTCHNFTVGPVIEEQRISEMFDYFYQDLSRQKFTDFSLVATRKTPNRPKENLVIKVHRFVLAAHSPRFKMMMQDLGGEDDSCLVLSGVNGTILRLIVQALYTGKVTLDGITQLRQFEKALRSLHSFGILLNLRPSVYFDLEEDDEFEDVDVIDDEEDEEELLKENEQSVVENVVEKTDVVEPTTPTIAKEDKPLRSSKRTRKEVDDKPKDEEENTPTKKRTRSTVESPPTSSGKKSSSKDHEANKPSFKNVTTAILNDKVKEGQIAFVKWLQKEGFLRKAAPDCLSKDCKGRLTLDIDEEAPDGVSWKCPKDKNHPLQSIREGSIFARQKNVQKKSSDSLSWIIQIILCWSDNTSLMKCQEMTGCQDVDKIFFWYDECRDYFGTV